jgi:hypothetical protein
MAITSKIDIDVDSAEFLALKTAFDKYETALKKMPAAWQPSSFLRALSSPVLAGYASSTALACVSA